MVEGMHDCIHALQTLPFLTALPAIDPQSPSLPRYDSFTSIFLFVFNVSRLTPSSDHILSCIAVSTVPVDRRYFVIAQLMEDVQGLDASPTGMLELLIID